MTFFQKRVLRRFVLRPENKFDTLGRISLDNIYSRHNFNWYFNNNSISLEPYLADPKSAFMESGSREAQQVYLGLENTQTKHFYIIGHTKQQQEIQIDDVPYAHIRPTDNSAPQIKELIDFLIKINPCYYYITRLSKKEDNMLITFSKKAPSKRYQEISPLEIQIINSLDG